MKICSVSPSGQMLLTFLDFHFLAFDGNDPSIDRFNLSKINQLGKFFSTFDRIDDYRHPGKSERSRDASSRILGRRHKLIDSLANGIGSTLIGDSRDVKNNRIA